jgi:hypothetical protein
MLGVRLFVLIINLQRALAGAAHGAGYQRVFFALQLHNALLDGALCHKPPPQMSVFVLLYQ